MLELHAHVKELVISCYSVVVVKDISESLSEAVVGKDEEGPFEGFRHVQQVQLRNAEDVDGHECGQAGKDVEHSQDHEGCG